MVHVPPGTSVEVALARRPEVLRLAGLTGPQSGLVANNPAPRTRHIYVPPVEPTLPTGDRLEAVAESFMIATDAMDEGNSAAAIVELEKAVQADPNYRDAWQKLGVAYENAGRPEKAKDAFRRANGAEPKVSLR